VPSKDGTVDTTTYYNTDKPAPSLEHTSTEHIDFQDPSLEHTSTENIDFQKGFWNTVQPPDHIDFQDSYLLHASIEHIDFQDPSLEHTSTEHTDFQDTYVECSQPKQALECPTTVALNAPFDSGYGSLGELVLDSKDDDAVSVHSLITNASQVNLPTEEKMNVILAFAADLCQDIGFSKYRPHERGRILASLSNLLKSFALRLEKNATSKAEHTAKEFLR
jgi:hypothetical protein